MLYVCTYMHVVRMYVHACCMHMHVVCTYMHVVCTCMLYVYACCMYMHAVCTHTSSFPYSFSADSAMSSALCPSPSQQHSTDATDATETLPPRSSSTMVVGQGFRAHPPRMGEELLSHVTASPLPAAAAAATGATAAVVVLVVAVTVLGQQWILLILCMWAMAVLNSTGLNLPSPSLSNTEKQTGRVGRGRIG